MCLSKVPVLRGLLQPVKFGSTHRLSLHLWKLRTESVSFAVCGDARKRKQKKKVDACGCHVEEVSTSRRANRRPEQRTSGRCNKHNCLERAKWPRE
jgi:hypothetical protein